MNRSSLVIGAVVIALLAAALVWFGLRPAETPAPTPPEPVAVAPAPPPVMPASEPAPTALPPMPAASTLPEPVPAAATLPPLPAEDGPVRDALIALMGKPAVLGFLQTDGFARRIVVTVDNLPRGHAAPRLWPVNPTEGRFTVGDPSASIALDNAERYGPFVRLVESVSPADAAALYRRLLPQMQAAYEELGYPGQPFQARLLAVIDHLLATPVPTPPVAVTLTDVKGPIPSERPWVRYEYADPSMESRSSGQKILMRLGEAHQRRLMGWLRQFRAQIAR